MSAPTTYVPQPVDTAPVATAPVASVPAAVAPMSQTPAPGYETRDEKLVTGPVAHGHGAAAGNEWTQGFFDCCRPADLCCMTFCCPCITYGRNYERMKNPAIRQKPDSANVPCLVYSALLCFAGLQFVAGFISRTSHREQMGIDGSPVVDCAAHFCCSCCALIQEVCQQCFRLALTDSRRKLTTVTVSSRAKLPRRVSHILTTNISLLL